MKRRALLVWGSLLVACLATGVTAAPAKPIVITVAMHTSPPGPEFEAIDLFKQMVETRSGGALTVQVFHSASLGGERDNIEQLTVGEVAMSIFGDLLTSLIAPELDPTVIPFVFPSIEEAFAYWESPLGQQLKKAVLDRAGIMVVGLQRRGDRQLTANRPIRTPDELRGLKLRVPEIQSWVKVWTALGALPTPVAWPEVFSALQTGVVDAQENPFFNIYQAKLYEVQRYLILTGHLPNMFHWTISKRFFDSLSPQHQQIVLEAAQAMAKYGDSRAAEQIEAFRRQLLALGMTEIVPDRAAFWSKARPAIQELARGWAPGVWEYVQRFFQ